MSDALPKRLRPARLLLAVMLSFAVCGAGLATAQDPAPNAEASESDAAETHDAETSEETEEGGSKVKNVRFSGLDISGRLKSPQLLYFLNRLRAEFARPKLPHRSFLPELRRSTKARGM